MATVKLSIQDKKDLDKFTKFLALKAAQRIVQSRLGEKVQTKCKPHSSGTDWVSEIIIFFEHITLVILEQPSQSDACEFRFLLWLLVPIECYHSRDAQILGDQILYGGATYLLGGCVELVACHPGCTWNVEITHRLKENLWSSESV
jgi:hypothetical protein